MMKKAMKTMISAALVLVFVLTVTACGNQQSEPTLWDAATYGEDTTLGDGVKTVTVEVTAEEKTVTFTVKTDEATVGGALMKHDLIDGEEGAYGLYVKVVNGITADYDADKCYWAFYVDGEYASTGVESTPIAEGVTYRFVYTKG